MRKRSTTLLPLLACCVAVGAVGLGAAGCQKNAAEGTSATAGPKPASPEEAKRFVETLRRMPAAQRQAYVTQHPEMPEGVNKSGDPKLMSAFLMLMRETGAN